MEARFANGGHAQPGNAEPIVRVVLRPLGSVLPLGFLAFGTGAFTTACYSLGWIAEGQGRTVFLTLLVFTVPIQFLCGILAFLSRDTPGGTTLIVFGATWAALGLNGISLKPGETSSGLGVFLVAVGVAILLLALAAIAGNPAFTVILGTSCARFELNGLYEITRYVGVEHAAGWVGLVVSIAAAYAGIAFLLEDAKQHPVLPMLRHGPAREALESGFPKQMEGLEHEPGVRANL